MVASSPSCEWVRRPSDLPGIAAPGLLEPYLVRSLNVVPPNTDARLRASSLPTSSTATTGAVTTQVPEPTTVPGSTPEAVTEAPGPDPVPAVTGDTPVAQQASYGR